MEPGEVRLYIDEDVHVDLALALRRQGFDAVNAHEMGLLSMKDPEVWNYFIQENRILFTYNVVHFAPRHKAWVEAGKEHPGIIFSSHYMGRVGPLIRDSSALLLRTDKETFRSNSLWV